MFWKSCHFSSKSLARLWWSIFRPTHLVTKIDGEAPSLGGLCFRLFDQGGAY